MMNHKKTLGIIGGLGPMATAYFMELVITMTKAQQDQEHLQMIVYNNPQIPDRTAYIRNPGLPSPVPEIINIGNLLSQQQVGCIVIPCITAHYFWQELQRKIPTPVLNTVTDTAQYLKRENIHCVGLMATDGTIATGVFQKALENAGIQVLLPKDEAQQGVMHLIYQNIKAGVPPDMELFRDISGKLFSAGAEVIILGCTELSLIKKDYELGPGFLDAMEVLAQQAIVYCGGEPKEAYRELITK